VDIYKKLNNHLKITGIINDMFRTQKTLKKTRTKFYNKLNLPAQLYSSENWTIKARDARRITTEEMKYMIKTAEYIWTDYKTNTDIAKELNITLVLYKI
jgi:beta-lactamase class D